MAKIELDIKVEINKLYINYIYIFYSLYMYVCNIIYKLLLSRANAAYRGGCSQIYRRGGVTAINS